MTDRFNFICGIGVKYISDTGKDEKVIIRITPRFITNGGNACFCHTAFYNELKALGLSDNELNQCIDFMMHNFRSDCDTDNCCIAKPEYMLQCTGLKDKNNKLVYEGDIVEADLGNDGWVQGKATATVIWDDATAGFKLDTNLFDLSYELEIIGHINEKGDNHERI